jgi:hypothetical protein
MPGRKTVDDSSRIEELLEELIFWTSLSLRDEARDRFNAILDSPEKRRVYEACDGEASQLDIQTTTGVPKSTLRGWMQEWQEHGIVRPMAGGKRRKLVSLRALGIGVPPLAS